MWDRPLAAHVSDLMANVIRSEMEDAHARVTGLQVQVLVKDNISIFS
jgi:hypothetical protein